MANKFKRFLSIALSVFMIMTMMPTGVLATEDPIVVTETTNESTDEVATTSEGGTDDEVEATSEETETEGEVTAETETEGEVTAETETEGEVTEETETEGEVTEETETEGEVTAETETEGEVTEETETEGEVTEETETEGEEAPAEEETAEEIVPAAYIGEVGYATLEEAIAAAEDYAEIELVAERIEVTDTIVINRSVSIYGAGTSLDAQNCSPIFEIVNEDPNAEAMYVISGMDIYAEEVALAITGVEPTGEGASYTVGLGDIEIKAETAVSVNTNGVEVLVKSGLIKADVAYALNEKAVTLVNAATLSEGCKYITGYAESQHLEPEYVPADEEEADETVTEEATGETVTEEATGETVTEEATGATVTEEGTGETVTEEGTGETVTEEATGETVTEEGTGETVTEEVTSATTSVAATMAVALAATDEVAVADTTTYVAKIEENSYTTLGDAVEAAEDGDTITLLADVDKLLTISKAITIDGNGFNVAGTAGENQFGAINGTVTLKNITFTNGNEAIRTDYLSADYSDLTLVINSCTFNNLTTYAIMGGKSDPDNHLLKELVVDNCTFNSANSSNYMVYAQCVGKLTVTACTFNGGSSTKGAIHTGDSTEHATDATISNNKIKGVARGVQIGNRVDGSSVAISGNTFTDVTTDADSKSGAIYVHSNADTNVEVSVTNNTATDCTNVMYNDGNTDISEIITTYTGNTNNGAAIYIDSNGVDTTTAPAEDTTAITTMADLVEAVKTAGSQLTVGAVLTVEEDAPVELDLNGCTVNMGAYYIENKGTLTISNGTLIANANNDATNGAPLFNYGGTLTINDGTYTGTIVALRVEGGTATINDGTFNVTNTDGTSSNHVVRMKGGTLTINGGIFSGNNAANGGEGCTIMSATAGTTEINGGTFNGFAGQALFGDGIGVTVKGGTFVPAGTDGFNIQACLANYLASGYEIDEEGKVSKTVSPAQIGDTGYETVEAAFTAAVDGNEVKINIAGTYNVPTGKNITITGAVDGVKFDMSSAVGVNASMTFNNVTFEYSNANYIGLQHAGTMVYNDCTINGQVFLYGASETFNNCTFNQNSADAYNVWTYGAKEVKFNECTFNCAGKSVLVYNEGACATELTVNETKFIATQTVSDKAAIEIDTSLMEQKGYKTTTITIDAATTAENFGTETISGSTLWNDKKADTTQVNGGTTSVVIVGGVTVKDSVENAPKGNQPIGYTDATKIWGETWSNAKASYVIKVLDADGTVMGRTTLNPSLYEFDGDVAPTWHISLDPASDTDTYWIQQWTTAPSLTNVPTTVELWVDGVKVSEGPVQLNSPDNLNKIYAAVSDSTGKILYYATTLQNAVTAATAGDTITLLRDVTLTEKITVNTTVTLDLNGKVIDGVDKCNIAIMSYGDLTIKDSSESQTGEIKAGKTSENTGNTINVCGGTFTLESGSIYSVNNAILIDENAATVNIKGGTITAKPETSNSAAMYVSSSSDTIINISGGTMTGYNGILLWNNTTINMTGGTIEGKGSTGIQGNGNNDNTEINISGDASVSGYYAAIYHPQAGKLNISGGKLTGWTGVVVKGGAVKISGGTISGTGEANTYEPASSGFVDTGDGLYVEHYDNSTNSQNYGTPTVTITGGTFNSTKAKAVASYANSNNSVEALTGFISGGTYSSKVEDALCAEGYKLQQNSDGTYGVVEAYVAKIGEVGYTTLAGALTAAQNGDTIDLIWAEGDAPIAMNGAVYGKSVTISGTATVDWSKGFLFIGRGGEGNGSVTFDRANLTSASDNASYGIHVSGREKDTTDKYDGTLMIKNSTIVLDYLINKGTMTLDNSTLTVKNGFSVGGRPASETESGEDATATLTLNNGSKVIVNNHNGMGLGYEAIGVMNVNSGSTFECTQSFLVTAKGTMNVNGGTVEVTGTLTNNGTVNVTDSTVVLNKLDNDNLMFLSGTNTIKVEDATGSSWAIRANNGVVLNDSYVKATDNCTVRLLGSATINDGFECAYLQGASTSKDGVGGILTIEEGTTVKATYAVDFGNNYTLNGGTIDLSGGNASGKIWGMVFQNGTFAINTDLKVDGNDVTAPIYFTNATATINSTITQKNSGGEPMYIGETSTVTLGTDAEIDTLSVHGTGMLKIDATGLSAGEHPNVKCGASGFTGTLEVIENNTLTAVINEEGKIELVAKPVAKVGEVEYASIEEAIAAWTSGTTLTLLADVTLSDVFSFPSTESRTLDLDTYTMTAAAGQHAIEITCNGQTSETYGLIVKADAENPGGITATGKSCIYYSKSGTTQDRVIISVDGGVFNGSFAINVYSSNRGTNCPQVKINGGTFNGNVNIGHGKLIASGGTFNGWVNCTGDSTAYRQISGGRYKQWQFMTADATNKFWVGTSQANYDVGVYVDDDGYLVVGGEVINAPGETFKASSANYGGWSSYLQYSSAATNGLYYTSVEEALADNTKTTSVVNVYTDTIDLTDTTYKGTLKIEDPLTVTFAEGTTPAWTVAAAKEGKVVTYTDAVADGVVARTYNVCTPVAKIGGTQYATFAEALNAVQNDETITLLGVESTAELKNELDFTKDIEFTITGEAPAYALPVITFQNATVNIEEAEILIPELDARQNATINVINSIVHDAGGNGIVKSYYNGAINISGTSVVYTMQVTTMGYITVSDTAKLNATWQTNVYGNGMITVNDDATFATAALHLTGQDYSDRDNTDADRVGKPAAIVVDGADLIVGKVYSNSGADYSYNSSKGINVGTVDGKSAVLDAKNGAEVTIYMANGETANIGADGQVNVAGSTFKVECRAANGSVTLANSGTINVSGTSDIAATVTGSGWVYMNGVTLDADTKLFGAKVGFINGTNTIVGSTIEEGWFSVGIGQNAAATAAAAFAEANGITLGDVTVNVSENAVIGATGDAYNGWIGSAYGADKTQHKYALNIKNSQAAFGYLHISKDGTLKVEGHTENKYTYDNASVDFYAGDFIINGAATLDATDAWAKFTKMSVDHADGVLNVINGTNFEASIHNGATTGNALKYWKSGTVNVDADSKVEIDNATILVEGAVLNIGGKVTAKGQVTGNGTINLTDASAVYTAAEDLTVNSTVEGYKVTYAEGAYTLVAMDPVAQIGEVTYYTLAAAIANAAEGATVVLIANSTEDPIKVEEGKNVTINLGNYTLTSNILAPNATLTISNGTIVNTNSDVSAIEINAGTLNLNGVTIDSARHAVRIDGAVAATIDGGTYRSAIGTGTGTYHAVNVSGAANVTIEAGTFVGPQGTTADSGAAVMVQSGANVTITGGNFSQGKNDTLDAKGTLSVTGGTFDQDPSAYVAEGYAALPNLSDQYVVGAKPTATVNDLGAMIVAAEDYMVYGNGTNTEDMPLSFVMQFLADQDEEAMETSPFAEWYGDFVITFTGIENGSFTADGCYLAGYYGSHGWVKVPVDGMTIENGTRYPVMLGVGLGQTYDYICSSVKDFRCAMYLTPEILAANPNLKVKLELSIVDSSKGGEEAAEALMDSEGGKTYKVTDYTYDVEDFKQEDELWDVYASNMTLGNTLDMNFFIKKTDLVGTDYYAVITHTKADGSVRTIKYEYADWEERSNYMVVTLDGIAAKQMTEEFTVCVYNSDGTPASNVRYDSIKTYAMKGIATTTNSEFRTALVDMLNYGAAAQKYFDNYNIEHLANADLDEYQQYATKNYSVIDNSTTGANYYGTTLTLESQIMLTVYFSGISDAAASDLKAIVTYTDHYDKCHTLEIEGTKFKRYNSDVKGVLVNSLVIADAKQLVSITVYNSDGTEFGTVQTSVESYLLKALSRDTLFEMIAKFTTSAYNYLH